MHIVNDILSILLDKETHEFGIKDLLSTKFDTDTYKKRMDKLISSSIYFKNEDINHSLFFAAKIRNNVKPAKDNIKYIKYFKITQHILSQYGINFICKRRTLNNHKVSSYTFIIDTVLVNRLKIKYNIDL